MCVGVGAFQTHTRSARTARGVHGIDANINGVAGLDETAAASTRSVEVAHVTIGGVRVLSKGSVSI